MLHLQFLQKYNDVPNRIRFHTQKRSLFKKKLKMYIRREGGILLFLCFFLFDIVAENFELSFYIFSLNMNDLIFIILNRSIDISTNQYAKNGTSSLFV